MVSPDNLLRREMLLAGGAALASVILSDVQIVADPITKQARLLPRAADVPAGTNLGVVMKLPPQYRTRNWGGGSCVHASCVSLLRWNGLMELADWWRRTYSGGEYDTRLVQRLEAAGVRYAFAYGGDDANRDGRDDGEEFLRWCIRTRRGAGIFYKPQHSINLVGMDTRYAYLLDNNATDYPERTGSYEKVPLATFFRAWHGFGGFAWTLVYDPPPEAPWARS